MSHAPERKENDCLNCGTIVQGRFCQKCGQENTVPHESFWSMLHHFFADITHFDGKFFSSLGIMLRKPGFLSLQYVQGRRNTYLNPVRMYVFTSALFFLVFFSFFNTNDITETGRKLRTGFSGDATSLLKEAYKNAKTHQDSVSIQQALTNLEEGVKEAKADSAADKMEKADSAAKDRPFKITSKLEPFDSQYVSLAQYDSIQHSLPAEKKDNWLRRIANRKSLEIEEHYKDNGTEFWIDVLEKFIHSIPYMLFVSLPLYALYLKLLYVRRKKFFYADHGIFLIHLYIFTFIVLLLSILLLKLKNYMHLEWLDVLIVLLFVYGFAYALVALKAFYKKGWVKTTLKFILFNLLCIFTLSLLFTVFFGLSIFRI